MCLSLQKHCTICTCLEDLNIAYSIILYRLCIAHSTIIYWLCTIITCSSTVVWENISTSESWILAWWHCTITHPPPPFSITFPYPLFYYLPIEWNVTINHTKLKSWQHKNKAPPSSFSPERNVVLFVTILEPQKYSTYWSDQVSIISGIKKT